MGGFGISDPNGLPAVSGQAWRTIQSTANIIITVTMNLYLQYIA
jgi:hypothetical protein